ncbi:response regulator [Paracoccus sp. MBLB3053]|uniref:Response regulator n=1 Tax=Paracoccus aurantius TaxID=3073814 RepID=A0ABU2HYS0_9RHOB|nr:response regulator [Paracoccus sp. MBLB3053]MDS9469429.1 response regulator [Paracoccus sp. MBLB3053]
MDDCPEIAVVDDDEAIRVGLSSLLRSENYRVGLFDCAEAFLGSLAQAMPQCLLTDIQLPGLSGLDLQFRMRVDHPELPVMVMTAFPSENARQMALATGAIRFLSKPFSDGELLDCLRSLLGRPR